MKLDHHRGALPLYLQIQETLKDQIIKGKYAYGDLIPSEQELEKMFGVSRITIRQAISDLEKEGYVIKQRGKGTTVTYSEKIDEQLTVIRSFTLEMQERGMIPGTKEVQIEKIPAEAKVAQKLGLSQGSMVYRLFRIRTANQEPLVVFETYVDGTYDLPMDPEEYNGSMYEWFEKEGIGKPVLVHESFEAILADTHLANLLHMKRGGAIFKRIRTAYNERNKPIEYTISYYRGDRYSYSVDLRSE